MGESCASIQRKKLDFFLTSNSEILSDKFCSSTIGKRCHVLETLSASNNVNNNFISSDVAYSSSRKVQSNHINNVRHYNMAARMENSCSNKVYPAPKIKNGHVSHSACYANPDLDTSVLMYQYSNSKNKYVCLVPTSDVSENFAEKTCTSAPSIHFSPPEKGIHKNGFKTYISTALKDDSLVDSSTHENSMSKRVSKIKIRSFKDVLSNSTQPVSHNKQSNNALDKDYSKNNSKMTLKGNKKFPLSDKKLKKIWSVSSYDKAVTNLTHCSSSAGRKIVINELTPNNTPRSGVPCPNNLPILEEMRLPITSSDSSTNSPKKESSEEAINKWRAGKIEQQRTEEKRKNIIKNRILLEQQEKKKQAEESTALWMENKIKESKENKKKVKERKAKELKEEQEKLQAKEIDQKKVDMWHKQKGEDLTRIRGEKHQRKLEEDERKRIKEEANAKAYQIWLKKSINKPKPLPFNRGLESIMSSSCITYRNPTPWQPNIPYSFTE